MLISYKWLQTYFDKKLPEPKEVARLFNEYSMEIEGIEEKSGDYLIDIDVLPNRAHDALSYEGIARELSVIATIPLKERTVAEHAFSPELMGALGVRVEEPVLCRRYVGRLVKNVDVKDSPSEIKEKLEIIGQRSINNIVDITNFVMLETGQPMHAFDADKVSGGIVVRKAKEGEVIETLDGQNVTLDPNTLVIADAEAPLAIAGVKGGKRAEVTKSTKNIILESANFDPVVVRKTSRKINILTDSSKRFENEITPELAPRAMEYATELIFKYAGKKDSQAGEVVEGGVYKRANSYKVGVSPEKINSVLGTAFSESEIVSILDRFGWQYEIIDPIDKVLAVAKTLEGKEYIADGSVRFDAPERFSCSSFTNYIYVEAGFGIPSISIDQYVYSVPVEEKNIQPGDLVFSNTHDGKVRHETVSWMRGTKVEKGVDHVGLYLGDGKIVHATRKAGKVIVEDLDSSGQFKDVVGVGRIVEKGEKRIVVTIPPERLDVRIAEDLIDEIGRVYGYAKISAQELSQDNMFVPQVNKEFYYAHSIRNILRDEGYSEVFTSSFAEKGDIEILNPLASDKGYVRSNLYEHVQKSAEFNEKYKDLLEVDSIKIFEIGKVFDKDGEHLALCILHNAGSFTTNTLTEKLGTDKFPETTYSGVLKNNKGEVIEIDLTKLVERLPDVDSYGEILQDAEKDVVYKSISPYPFIARDIAVFVPPGTTEDDVVNILKEESGELRVKGPRLFDRFEKKNKETGEIEKISYAFRIVFQSYEKTLTDVEVNEIMTRITTALQKNADWQVR